MSCLGISVTGYFAIFVGTVMLILAGPESSQVLSRYRSGSGHRDPFQPYDMLGFCKIRAAKPENGHPWGL